jgi:acyl carrier protein
MTPEPAISSTIKRFICAELAPEVDAADLRDDDSLLDSGILDSFGIMTLLSFIEQEYGVEVPAEDIEPENFESVTAIAQTISGYLEA